MAKAIANFLSEKKGWRKKRVATTKDPQQMPGDLDKFARAKWRELIKCCDPDVDAETLANYCRLHATLLGIRSEKARQIKGRAFQTTVKGRDGTMVLNPLLVSETRIIASLNRMLKLLGFSPSQDERGAKRAPPDVDEIDPLEAGLCWPYGRKKIEIWREIRRGKIDHPTNAAEQAELGADRVRANRRLAEWKLAAGIVDDGDDGPIPAPGLNASAADWSAYHIVKQQQTEKIEGAIRRAGLDPRKQ